MCPSNQSCRLCFTQFEPRHDDTMHTVHIVRSISIPASSAFSVELNGFCRLNPFALLDIKQRAEIFARDGFSVAIMGACSPGSHQVVLMNSETVSITRDQDDIRLGVLIVPVDTLSINSANRFLAGLAGEVGESGVRGRFDEDCIAGDNQK